MPADSSSGRIQCKTALQPIAPTVVSAAVLITARLLPLPGRDGTIAHLPSVCLFHNLTGLPCPGCGLTRSLVCLAHGRLAESFAYHPLGPLIAAALVLVIVLAVAQKIDPKLQCRVSPSVQRSLSFAGLALMLIAWGVRLMGWDPLPN